MIRLSEVLARADDRTGDTGPLAPVVPLRPPNPNQSQSTRNGPPASVVELVVPGLQDAGELERVLARHLRELERVRHQRPNSITERRRAIRRADGWLRAHRGVDLLQASTADLEEWQLELAGGQSHHYTQVGHLKLFYGWLHAKGYLPDNPAADLERGKKPKRAPRLPDDQVVNRALTSTDDIRLLLVLMLAIFCGLRATEIAALRIEDVHTDGDTPWLMVYDGKGGKDRRVPIPRQIAALLARLLPDGEWVIERRDGRPGPLTRNGVSKLANLYLHEVVGTTRTLHGLRHWYATRSYEIDYNLVGLQLRLGHDDISSTVIYVSLVDDEHSRPTVEQLGDLLPEGLAEVHDLEARRHRRGDGHRDKPRRAARPVASVADPFPRAHREMDAVSCHQLPGHGHHDRIR